MAAQLATTVFVKDPDSHQTVELAPGTSPEPRLAALVTNPAAWVDGKLPRLPKKDQDGSPTGNGPDDASGADSGADSQPDQGDKPAAKKTAARKTGVRGRAAADEGTSGE